MFPKPQSNTTDTFTPSEIAFLYVFRSLWSNLKNLSKCLKSRILTNLSDVVQLLSPHGSTRLHECHIKPVVYGNISINYLTLLTLKGEPCLVRNNFIFHMSSLKVTIARCDFVYGHIFFVHKIHKAIMQYHC